MPTFRIVWLLRNLSLGGKLCLRDDKNSAFVSVHHPLPLQASIENVTLRRTHKQEAVSDWLNPHSLRTMSAYGCIENLA